MILAVVMLGYFVYPENPNLLGKDIGYIGITVQNPGAQEETPNTATVPSEVLCQAGVLVCGVDF